MLNPRAAPVAPDSDLDAKTANGGILAFRSAAGVVNTGTPRLILADFSLSR